MIKYIIPFLMFSTSAFADIEAKCYGNEEFMKAIDDNKLLTFFNGQKGTKTFEVMMGKGRTVYTVEYDTNNDGNAMVAKQYCVTNVIKDSNFNENAVEILHDALEKVKGQKT
jgi:hypothetical protein